MLPRVWEMASERKVTAEPTFTLKPDVVFEFQEMAEKDDNSKRRFRLLRWARRRWWVVILILLIVLLGLVSAAEYVTSRPGFCANCHNMTPYYDSWVEDAHSKKGIICVDCHYAPGELHTLKAKLRGLSQVTSYLGGSLGGSRLRAHVDSASCMTSDCHPPGSFETKPLTFPKPLPGSDEHNSSLLKPFTHEKHLGELSTGQDLECASC